MSQLSRKWLVASVTLCVAIVLMSGCGNSEQASAGKGALKTTKVEDVLREQVEQESSKDLDKMEVEAEEETTEETEQETVEEAELENTDEANELESDKSEEALIAALAEEKLNEEVNIAVQEPITEVDVPTADDDSGVDYDLTTMNNDMVYAMVYQMMVDPSQFEGKMVRMQGMYYATYFPEEEQYYHAVIIKDALACCAQGIEFIWGDGSHIYPDEYPEQESEVVVTGRFETYRGGSDDWLYCHLVESTLEPINE